MNIEIAMEYLKETHFTKKQPDQFLCVKNNSSNQVVNITV